MADVGIVMPVYKQDLNYLELALNSVLKQDYQNFYFVIVSDGAPPEVNNKITELTAGDNRVHFIIKEKNEGVSKALNTGFDFLMKFVEVEYLTWVSSDNIYFQNFIEKLREALVNGPEEIGLVYSSFRHIDHDGKHILNEDLLAFRKFQEKPKESLLDLCYIGTSFMYKKIYASKTDGYFMEPVEDYEYWLRLTDHCDIKYVPTELMDYRVASPHSISAQLQSSVYQHRRWRYTFNLAKQQTRNRRNIPFEVTIVFPVQQLSEITVSQYEHVLNQSYSNYKFLVIDLSPRAKVSQTLKQISDPRVAFFHLPNKSMADAIKLGIELADTPYTLLFKELCLPVALDSLALLVDVHHQLLKEFQHNEIASTFFIDSFPNITSPKSFKTNAGFIGFSRAYNQSNIILNQLYNTNSLKKLNNRSN
ncbi:glycosyltransferase family 2 protein [Priestia megaterium]|uniref:glycosyltransferase family 2 protein n=1 Tax=Priestia megaterium TaxID=1404 RepID=UPI002E1B0D5A|nr:glycosyltransferase family 2 protein [Priestia megaterium]